MKINENDIKMYLNIEDEIIESADFVLSLEGVEYPRDVGIEVDEEVVLISWCIYACSCVQTSGQSSFPTSCLYEENREQALKNYVFMKNRSKK